MKIPENLKSDPWVMQIEAIHNAWLGVGSIRNKFIGDFTDALSMHPVNLYSLMAKLLKLYSPEEWQKTNKAKPIALVRKILDEKKSPKDLADMYVQFRIIELRHGNTSDNVSEFILSSLQFLEGYDLGEPVYNFFTTEAKAIFDGKTATYWGSSGNINTLFPQDKFLSPEASLMKMVESEKENLCSKLNHYANAA